jgi:hypothetical protein
VRLPARVRFARLFAIEAHDHYVRVHTDAGTELVTARFADAVDELVGVHGFRVYRSWWDSGSAIRSTLFSHYWRVRRTIRATWPRRCTRLP